MCLKDPTDQLQPYMSKVLERRESADDSDED